MKKLIEYWKTELKKIYWDTRIQKQFRETEVKNRELKLSWIQRGKERTTLFEITPDRDFRWKRGKCDFRSYNDFLISDQMSDYAQFADAITK